VSEGEADLAKQATLRAATLHLDQKPTGGQPAYTLLHPESPPTLLPPGKSGAGTGLPKPRGKRAAIKDPQKPRVEASLTKKDKAPSKVKVKKKKAPQPTTMKSKGSEDSNG
jgi:hypothetical protein